jgi:hypothetical protein
MPEVPAEFYQQTKLRGCCGRGTVVDPTKYGGCL